MVTEKRRPPAAVKRGPKERHRRAQRPQNGPLSPVVVPDGLVAKPPLPISKCKHHTYFEFVENKEKKKKLQFVSTHFKRPPPDFEFVPIGIPELTSACKELSRECGVVIFIVTATFSGTSHSFANQMNRLGYHFHVSIVREARSTIVGLPQQVANVPDGEPEPIPECQQLYHSQVDAAMRDLFPRIPNTDRQLIIQHAFTRGTRPDCERPVGLCPDITLARRVQLAVLAHIRHNHTRYDELLKEAPWSVARKAVQSLCLDILVKWRGDEETGRDQLDEILREVVVISDSEDGESEDESTDGDSVHVLDTTNGSAMPHRIDLYRRQSPRAGLKTPGHMTPPRSRAAAGVTNHGRSADRRGFKRYRAWEEAIQRNRDAEYLDLLPIYDLERPLERPLGQHATNRPSDAYEPQPLFAPVGNAPTSNGFTSHHIPLYQQLPENVSTAPVNTVHEEVISVVREPQFRGPGSYGRTPPVGHHFQDMLVRSVEPALPEHTGPSFIAGIPVRAEEQMEHPSIRHPMRHHYGRTSSPAPQPARDELGSSARQVISDHLPHGRAFPAGLRPEGSLQALGQRDLNLDHSDFRGNPEPMFSLPYRTARVHEPRLDQPAADRIVVNASRPGTRPSPILMEDRGGFYERVTAHPELVPLETRDLFEAQRPAREALERHIVVSREEGSRILQESQATMGVEVMPIRRSGTIAPVARSHDGVSAATYVASNPWEHGGHTGVERSRLYGAGYGPDSRPVSGECRPLLPQPYQEELRADTQSFSAPHHPLEADFRQHRERLPTTSGYFENYRREYPFRVSQPGRVDVFR